MLVAVGTAAVGGVAGIASGSTTTTTAGEESLPGAWIDAAAAAGEYVLRQGDRCVPLHPVSGSEPIEDFYDYRLPERYASAENGGSDPGNGPYYSSSGTEAVQRPDASVLLLYDGPDGVSLVVVHDALGESPGGGGSATLEFSGLPTSGRWVVKDDLYRDQETGEVADGNFDRWWIDGSTHVVDWTWGTGATDGGAFRGIGGSLPVTIRPAFNGDATLHGKHYDGTIEAWQAITVEGDARRRVSLDMTTPVTIERGRCGDDPAPGRGSEEPAVEAVEFEGCGEAWVVFAASFTGTVPVVVETSQGGRREHRVTAEALRTVRGQFGDRPLVKLGGRGKVLAVEVLGQRYENDHECASAGRDGDGRGPPDDRGNGDDDRGDDEREDGEDRREDEEDDDDEREDSEDDREEDHGGDDEDEDEGDGSQDDRSGRGGRGPGRNERGNRGDGGR